jgi:8-oxo-dGTP pyrophosphatase MutT (NUDIX family)
VIKEQIRHYVPFNDQEQYDQEAILGFIERNPDFLLRSNPIAHMTSSSIVVNASMTKVLFAYHNIYQSWGWLGGHNDGDDNCLHVAVKETKEETGVKNVTPFSENIFMLETIMVPNHIKKGKHISDHLHLNITYLLVADETDPLFVNPDENSNVAWFLLDEALEKVTEPHMLPIYRKALKKIDLIKSQGGFL